MLMRVYYARCHSLCSAPPIEYRVLYFIKFNPSQQGGGHDFMQIIMTSYGMNSTKWEYYQ